MDANGPCTLINLMVKIYVKSSGTWKPIKEMYVKVKSTWKRVWNSIGSA
jgi:hypothetical protein